MKTLSVIAFFWLISHSAFSQSFSEWFKQKKTQTKYSLAQIVALKAYSDILNKGYGLIKDSLFVINSNKEKDLQQHSDYYQSLKSVSPVVRQSNKVTIAVNYATQVMEMYSIAKKYIDTTEWLNPIEKDYTIKVAAAAVEDCNKSIDELKEVTSDGELEMKTDERLRKLDEISSDIRGIYVFLKSFHNGNQLLARQRQKESLDSRRLQKIIE
ncbi:hypothetical protein [Filimonas effusa]|uniref:TerB family tellurite resistance protein n=1 Tax=Filimonas effusa TaxID=2508721 RepID=A0A4Q1DEF7_9BACT|nr:hypothetical protein [Filimonas effusa]RXK86989.1 hypothetical protein ESB13_09460 [Filimonas effusa]